MLNRLTSETDPLGNGQTMAYDAVGNLISLSNPKGTFTYSYDENNRLKTLTYPDATTVSYVYDENGNRLSVSDWMGTTSHTYTMLDQISSVTDPFGMTVRYTYDPNGNRTSTKYPGNRSVFYYFDSLNRLFAVADWGGITTNYEYDSAGRLVAKTMGNNATFSYRYDNAGRLTAKEDRDPGGSIIASYTYTLDPVGNRKAMRMTQPLIPRVDSINNSFTHNPGNQVISGTGMTFTYDREGNRTERNDGSVTTQYAYSYDDMLTRVEKGSDINEYLYNSDGQRLSSKTNGAEASYLLDVNEGMENILAEMSAGNIIKAYYVQNT